MANDRRIIVFEDYRPKKMDGRLNLTDPDQGKWYRENMVLSGHEAINARIITDQTKLGAPVSSEEAYENNRARTNIMNVLANDYPRIHGLLTKFIESLYTPLETEAEADSRAAGEAKADSMDAAAEKAHRAAAIQVARNAEMAADDDRMNLVDSLKRMNPVTTGARHARDVAYQIMRALGEGWGGRDFIPSFDRRHVGGPASKAAHWGLWGASGLWGATKVAAPVVGGALAWAAVGTASNARHAGRVMRGRQTHNRALREIEKQKRHEKELLDAQGKPLPKTAGERTHAFANTVGPWIAGVGAVGTGVLASSVGAAAHAAPGGILVEGVYAGLFALNALNFPIGLAQGKGRKAAFSLGTAAIMYFASPFAASALIDARQVSPNDPVINTVRTMVTPVHMQNIIPTQATNDPVTLGQISPFGAINNNVSPYHAPRPIQQDTKDALSNVTPTHPVLVQSIGYMPVHISPVFSSTDISSDYLSAGDVRCVIGYDAANDTVQLVSTLKGGKGYDPRTNFAFSVDQSPAAIAEYCGPIAAGKVVPSSVSENVVPKIEAPRPFPYPIRPDTAVKSGAPVLKT